MHWTLDRRQSYSFVSISRPLCILSSISGILTRIPGTRYDETVRGAPLIVAPLIVVRAAIARRPFHRIGINNAGSLRAAVRREFSHFPEKLRSGPL